MKTWNRPLIDIQKFSPEDIITASPTAIEDAQADVKGANGKFLDSWIGRDAKNIF